MSGDSYIQSLFAERLGGNNFGKEKTIYKFEKIKRAKREAMAANPGVELIDIGVGEPDEMAFPEVVESLKVECALPENRGYADNGISEFKEAAARYMENIFGVANLNPETEIMHSIGSKPALAMIPAIFINKGDAVFMTTPGYPVLGTHAKWYGGDVINLPLLAKNNFLPALDNISDEDKKRGKVLYINYPNNPTGAMATLKFYEKVVAFAKKYNVVVIQDAAYASLTYSQKPLSFLTVDGAKEVGVEIHSLSKSFNMTGWRLAFVAGNELIVKGYGYVKDNYDSGQFIAIQKAGISALRHTEITDKIKEKYHRRLKMMAGVFSELGFNAKVPGGTFYLYTAAPKGILNGRKFESAEDFSQYLIKEKLISTVPWDDVGSYIRLSATFSAKGEDEEKRVMTEIKKRLSGIKFLF